MGGIEQWTDSWAMEHLTKSRKVGPREVDECGILTCAIVGKYLLSVYYAVLPYAINDLPGPYSWRIYFYVGEVNIKQENKS